MAKTGRSSNLCFLSNGRGRSCLPSIDLVKESPAELIPHLHATPNIKPCETSEPSLRLRAWPPRGSSARRAPSSSSIDPKSKITSPLDALFPSLPHDSYPYVT